MKISLTSKYKIKAIVLAGHRDFGRCPIASRMPTALWPVAGRTAIELLLESLASQGLKQVVISSNDNSSVLRKIITADSNLKLDFIDDILPSGTAGCIRDVVGSEPGEILLLFSTSMICPPSIDTLIKAHAAGKSDMTIIFNPPENNGKRLGTQAGIYVCNKTVLEHIPKQGYFDIKEGLIPEMLRSGRAVHAAVLPKNVYCFRDRQGYLSVLAAYLAETPTIDADLRLCKEDESRTIWKGTNVRIGEDVKVFGPVVLMDGAQIKEGTIIFGPTIVGPNVEIGRDNLIIKSTFWDGARIGSNCEIRESIVDYNATVSNNTAVQRQAVAFTPDGILKHLLRKIADRAAKSSFWTGPTKSSAFEKVRRLKLTIWLAPVALVIAFLWSYWPNLVDLVSKLSHSDEYSSGLLVPLIAIYVLWARRQTLVGCQLKPCMWGILALIAVQMVRLFGLFFMFGSAERLSIVLTVAALVLFLFGWQLFRRIWTILLFLLLMLPWPNRIQTAVTLPLQSWATSSAVFCLELFGFEVVRQGNIIEIGNTSVAVAEACNGLRMVMAFFVITGLVVLLIKRTWWEKVIIFASSLPVALLCNTARLTITAIAFTVINGQKWEKIFHDFGGYAMMPLALAIIVAELWLLTRLTVMPNEQQSIVITRNKT